MPEITEENLKELLKNNDWYKFRCAIGTTSNAVLKLFQTFNGLSVFNSLGCIEINADHDTIYVLGPQPSDIPYNMARVLAINGWDWNKMDSWRMLL